MNQSNCSKTIRVEGDLDADSVPRLLQQVETALDVGYQHFILDLSQMTQVNLCGKLALQVIASRVAERGRLTILSGQAPGS